MFKQIVAVMAWSSIATSVALNPVMAVEVAAAPADVSRFVGPHDTLLAYQTGDLFGPGVRGAVLIIRHPIPDEAYEFDRNPCDLIVLKGQGQAAVQFAKGTTTVDCVYNDLNKTQGPMSLNDLVEIKPGYFSFINQKDRGADRFYFRYSAEKAEWYLARATATFAGSSGLTTEEATYPRDFGWTSLSAVSPDALAKALGKNKTVAK